MIKKLLFMSLATLLCVGFSVNVEAADFNMAYSPENIKPGEQFSVTITLDETIPMDENITCVQGELYFDSDVLTYVSHEMSDAYEYYMSKYRQEKARLQFSNLSVDTTAFEVPEGEILSVVFSTAQEVTENELQSMIHLKMKISTMEAETSQKDVYASVVIAKDNIHIEDTEIPEGEIKEEQSNTSLKEKDNVLEENRESKELTEDLETEEQMNLSEEATVNNETEKNNKAEETLNIEAEASDSAEEIIDIEKNELYHGVEQNSILQNGMEKGIAMVTVLITVFVIILWVFRKKHKK